MAVGGADREPGMGGIQHFTYEYSDGRFHEVQLFRGVHPMMGERLHLWRLKNFKIDRLPSVEDVYLLHAVANENPKDERLFAVAEVRDLDSGKGQTTEGRGVASSGAHVLRGDRSYTSISDEALGARAAVLEPHISLCVAHTEPQT